MTDQPALIVENLSVRYPGYQVKAVDSVSFQVEKGVIAALIGPNGSGKTTIIRSILGLITYEGAIKVFGKAVEEMYQDIGYVPQRFNFDPTFPVNVYEFIGLILQENTSRKQISNKVEEVLSYVGGEKLRDKKLSTLSGGQLQRVLLARALVKGPDLLLLDEPEAGVDVGGEQTFYDLLEKLVKDKSLTALVSSHELDVVYTYAEQVVCINKTMLCSGAPQDVLDKETFEKLYGRDLKFYGHSHKDVPPHTHNH